MKKDIAELLDRIFDIKNVEFRRRKEEIEIHAPDPDEEGEEKALDILTFLHSEAVKLGFKCEAFHRGEKVDALRIYLAS